MNDAEKRLVATMQEMGFGRSMQLAEQGWREVLSKSGSEGGEFASYCCAVMLVPCPGCAPARAKGGSCDWCCGAGRVTEKVRDAITQERTES